MTTRGSLHGASPTARLGGVLLGSFSALMAMSIVMGEETLRPTWEQIDQALLERQLWLHNDIGITDDVPPPWTPVRVHIRSRRDAEIEMLGDDIGSMRVCSRLPFRHGNRSCSQLQ